MNDPQIQGEGKEIERVFKHISCRIEAEEAEGVSDTMLDGIIINVIIQAVIFVEYGCVMVVVHYI